MQLVIASRKSDLARIQAYAVGDALKKKFPHLNIQFEFRESLGDKNLNDPLWKMPERGVFTEDFYQGLVSGKWDMVVHSWKDLPVEERPDTLIAGTMARADVRDVLLFKKSSLKAQKKELTVYTSSPRRIYNLGNCLEALLPLKSKIHFDSVRGNVQTRVRKLLEGSQDGLVVAKAGLDRLLSADRPEFAETQLFLRNAFKELHWMILPVSLNPTAAAQGALAIEVASANTKTIELVKSIHCEETFKCVQAERLQLKQWGGGCHQKIGINIFKRNYGTVVMARGLRDSGETIDIQRLEPQNVVTGKFQDDVKSATWFDRVEIAPPLDTQTFTAHWVARAVALPSSISFDPESTVLWTSGTETWKRLADRGLWVNGTSDSLGEQEAPNIEILDGTARKWCKWTHSEGEEFKLGPMMSSYKLVPKNTPPLLDSATDHFYWMSGSSFERAIEVYPWLLTKTHWSGPGNTHFRILKCLENHRAKGAARIALNLEQWQKLKASP